MTTVSEDQWATWHAFYRMRRRLDRALDRQLQIEAGLSAAEYELMIALNQADRRALRVTEIASMIGWELSRVSHLVARMERRGSVERMPCETDGRGSVVRLTTDGRRAVLAAMHSHTRALSEYFLDQMDDSERRVVERVSNRVIAAIGSGPDADAGPGT